MPMPMPGMGSGSGLGPYVLATVSVVGVVLLAVAAVLFARWSRRRSARAGEMRR